MSNFISDIESGAQKLEDLDLEGLRRFWRNHYGSPPRIRSLELFRLNLAWRLQAEAMGGLDRESRRHLRRRGSVRAEGLEFGVGAKLRRDWQGKTVEVIVAEEGFHWNGKSYRSLSGVATAIAGSRWNGPRFFGLRPDKK